MYPYTDKLSEQLVECEISWVLLGSMAVILSNQAISLDA